MVETATPRPVRGQLAVVGIFALGVVFGIALSFALVHRAMPAPREGPPRGGGVPMERMTRELGLDGAQKEKVRAILERGHATMRGVLDDTSREVRAVLRPDQREKFDRMRPRSPFPHVGHRGGAPPGEPPPEPPPEPPR